MEVVDDLVDCPRPPGGTVVTIGAYDGVHLGHQRLIAAVRDLAAARGCASAVVTFDRHPALIVRPASAPKLLTDLETRLELLAATGLDYAVVVRFDEARSKEPAADFVTSVLVGCLAVKVVVVGHDFHFGHDREGNVALLQLLGPSLGFEVCGVGLFDDGLGGGPISSTRIRAALEHGDVELAAALLGRPHLLRGDVVAPEGTVPLGLEVPVESAVPAPGTYAGWWRGGPRRRAALVTVTGGDHRLGVALLEGPAPGPGRATVEFVGRAGDRGQARRLLERAPRA